MKKLLLNLCCGTAMLFSAGVATTVATTDASAHGERAQEPFLRMRTLNWFDVAWEKTTVGINESIEVTGKVRIAPRWSWPGHQPPPDTAFLNIAVPGPVFVREAAYISGTSVMNSGTFHLGETYSFKVVMRGRLPGHWHVHPMMNVEGAGPIVGPGKYVDVTGDPSTFTNKMTTLTGEEVELESYGLANSIFWHSLWAAIGVAWLVFWLVRPLFFSRYRMVEAGRGNELISRFDKMVALILFAGAITLTFVGAFQADARWPVTLPLQGGRPNMEPIKLPVNEVAMKLIRATYRVPGREMKMRYLVTNNTNEAVRVGEFNTAGVRFLNGDVGFMDEDSKNYPDHLLAENGLTVPDTSPIQPGESREVQMDAKDAAWETERLSSLIYDPDSNYGGMVFFYGESGKRYISDVGGVLVPQFR